MTHPVICGEIVVYDHHGRHQRPPCLEACHHDDQPHPPQSSGTMTYQHRTPLYTLPPPFGDNLIGVRARVRIEENKESDCRLARTRSAPPAVVMPIASLIVRLIWRQSFNYTFSVKTPSLPQHPLCQIHLICNDIFSNVSEYHRR